MRLVQKWVEHDLSSVLHFLEWLPRKEAQLDVEGQFLVRLIYEDAKTYDLVAAASKVLSE